MIGIVYCIREISSDKIIYVGSTTHTLQQRKSHHKTYCYKYEDQRLIYQYIHSVCPDKNDFDNHFVFELLETLTINERNELRALEEKYIREIPTVLNSIKAFRTEQEFKEYNNKRSREYQKTDKWRDYQREYKREYRKRKNHLTV